MPAVFQLFSPAPAEVTEKTSKRKIMIQRTVFKYIPLLRIDPLNLFASFFMPSSPVFYRALHKIPPPAERLVKAHQVRGYGASFCTSSSWNDNSENWALSTLLKSTDPASYRERFNSYVSCCVLIFASAAEIRA